jgi:hypothetical protein
MSVFDELFAEAANTEMVRRARIEEMILAVATSAGAETVEIKWPDDLMPMPRYAHVIPGGRRRRRQALRAAGYLS